MSFITYSNEERYSWIVDKPEASLSDTIWVIYCIVILFRAELHQSSNKSWVKANKDSEQGEEQGMQLPMK